MGSFRSNVTIILVLFKFKIKDKVFYLEKEYSAIFFMFFGKKKADTSNDAPALCSEK